MSKLIKDFHRLWERLIELSNKSIPDVSYSIIISAKLIMKEYTILRIEENNVYYKILLNNVL